LSEGVDCGAGRGVFVHLELKKIPPLKWEKWEIKKEKGKNEKIKIHPSPTS
jgi:hypothetical protein